MSYKTSSRASGIDILSMWRFCSLQPKEQENCMTFFWLFAKVSEAKERHSEDRYWRIYQLSNKQQHSKCASNLIECRILK